MRQKEGVEIGKVSGSYFKKEVLTDGQLNHHVHVVGASGFGKTVLLSHIIKQRIEKGSGLLFIDLKGDIETIMKFSRYAIDSGRAEDLMCFSLSDPKYCLSYNPISDGTANQIRDRIMQSLNWSEEYYRNQSASYLLRLLIVLCWLRDRGRMGLHLGIVLAGTSNLDWLEGLAAEVTEEDMKVRRCYEECIEFLRAGENYKSLQGLRTQLESLLLADFGSQLTESKAIINLFDAVNSSKIVFMFLDSRRYGESARSLGRFVLEDLKAASARVDAEIEKEHRRPFSVIIDEFADLAQEDFIGFLDRARSSKMSVVVAHQEICDLMRISPEFAGRLMGNTSTLYAFLQKRPESAEMISGIAGTRPTWKSTYQTERWGPFVVSSGSGSKREVEEYVIHPNQVKSLGVGKCVCIKKYPSARAYVVEVAYEG